jgi:hypothetical protein
MLTSEAQHDLGRTDCIRLSIQRAFPLPSTGAFTDLLAALDSQPGPRGHPIENFPVKPSTSAEQ